MEKDEDTYTALKMMAETIDLGSKINDLPKRKTGIAIYCNPSVWLNWTGDAYCLVIGRDCRGDCQYDWRCRYDCDD